MSLILTKEEKFARRVDLAKFLRVNIDTLNKWTRKYKELGLKKMRSVDSGGKRREEVPKSIHKEIEDKLNNSTAPLQGYTDAVTWIKEEFGYEITHYKKSEVAFEALKKNS